MPKITLPEDDAVLTDQLLQWWYWTGHLQSTDGRKFGFEVVFFTGDVGGMVWGQMAQSAISDLGAKAFVDQEKVYFGQPKVIPNAFDLISPDGTIAAKGGDGIDTLHTVVGGYTLDLSSKALRPPVLHYGGLDHKYSFGGDTYYYSRESLAVDGKLRLPTGEELVVSGSAWFDRQYGELVFAVLYGWQWFAIQLDGDVQIMIFDYKDHPSELYGSITDASGNTTDLGPSDITITITSWWTSPESGIRYPHGWTVKVPGHDLVVTPQLDDQELTGRFWLGPRYWEGACTVSGSSSGSAYVELVGFTPA